MCTTIVIDRGEKEIETPREFKEHFGFLPIISKGYLKEGANGESWEDFCLCSCEIEQTFNENKIPFKFDGSDYYVGMLEQIIIS